MRWTRAALKTRAPVCGRRSRVVLTPRRWRQVLEKQASQGRRWQESPVAGESAQETVKTIARGMLGDFRCDLTNACALSHYYCTRGYRAHRAPGIPCALGLEGKEISGKPRANQAARSRSCVFRQRRCLKMKYASVVEKPNGKREIRPPETLRPLLLTRRRRCSRGHRRRRGIAVAGAEQ